jgi:nucleotide-binding universal stress UspA family protein
LKDKAKILVAYDGSDFSKRALREAVDVAKKFGGSVTLLHVFWDPKLKKLEETELRDQPTLKLLDEIEKELKNMNVKYEMRSERSEDVPNVIVKIAKDEGFDCIVMGSRGMGGAKAWLLGSVSSKVVTESPCPVIIVK